MTTLLRCDSRVATMRRRLQSISLLASLLVLIATVQQVNAYVVAPATLRRSTSRTLSRVGVYSPSLSLLSKKKNRHAAPFHSHKDSDSSSALIEFPSSLNELNSGMAAFLMPFASTLDQATDGWALTYADLSPETESTPAGVSFLATNMAYGAAGLLLSQHGDGFYGFVTEAAGVVSFLYHYTQLKLGPNQAAVRLALLVDYIFAGVAILTTTLYLATGGLDQMPVEGLVVGALSVASLSLSWVWEVGYPYLFWHSLWHLLSAYAGYLVGQAHMAAAVATTLQ